MARESSLQELVTASFDAQIANQYTAIPCIVVSVDGPNMVSIQPTINNKSRDGSVVERPPILGVPVSFPVSDTAGMTFPIKVGTTGVAIFSMRNLDGWKGGNGRAASPLNFAVMDKGDAMFYPGLQPPGISVNSPVKHVFSHDINDTVMFSNLGGNEAEVRIKADGSIEINTSQQPVTINCSEAIVNATTSIQLTSPAMIVDVDDTTWVGNINHTGNYTGTGVQTFNGVIFSTHDHIPGPGPSNP
jgi:hypothetical protein